jgi:cyclopropane-fatty-acyl-phospholipid synthase
VDVRLDGKRPWDIDLRDEKALDRILSTGSLGLGESYVDGQWECAAIDEFFDKLLWSRLHRKVQVNPSLVIRVLRAKILNLQNRDRSKKVAEIHYDLGNEFYEAMLDPYMQYTCGYWQNGAKTLAEAQEAKLDLVCRKLQLKPGEKVLELGCGWGGFARFAASRYGVEVVGYNISVEQVAWAREKCKGLPVDIRLSDYRDAEGEYDKVVSIGMCEHVGWKNLRSFCQLASDRLKPEGVFLLHTIGGFRVNHENEPWIDKHIFPGSFLPSPSQIATAFDGLFMMEDWHNFGPDYDTTLMAWNENFEKAWPRFADQYGDRFRRMWRYYLLFCAGTFRSRYNQLYQVVLSKKGIRGGWRAVR